jgi:DNA-directed RNA polymerase subunit RPC12/RpoP
MQETRCRACNSAILVAVSPEDRGLLEVNIHVDLEDDGIHYFVRCPNCSAKNLAIIKTYPSSNPIAEIVRAVIDGQ